MDAQEKKLRQSIWIIIGVGIFLTLLLAAGLITQVVNKQRAQIKAQQTQLTTLKSTGSGLAAALVAKQKAEDNREYVKGQLAFFRQRFRSIPFKALTAEQFNEREKLLPAPAQNALLESNRNEVWRRWMNEYASGYGPALQRELIVAANQTGVILKTGVKVGDPPRAPEECVPPANGLFRPTGGPLSITVTGALSNIMQFFNRINQSSILMMVNNDLRMSGASPDITATFSVQPYLLASGQGAPVTAGAAAVGGAAPAVTGEGGVPVAAAPATGGSANSAE